MKKIGVVLGLLAASFILAWVYFANKFEQIVKDEILPKIKSSEHVISTDTESVVIEKYKFRITFKDVTIFPKSTIFEISIDQLFACYNPFSDKIIVHFTDDKLKMGSGKAEIYGSGKNEKIEFNRALLNSNKFEDVSIVISSDESSAYFASDNSLISHVNKSKMSLTSKLDKDGFYNIDFKCNASGMESSTLARMKYTQYVLEDLISSTEGKIFYYKSDNKSFEKAEQVLGRHDKTLSALNPSDYNSEFSIRLDKKHVENIIAAVKGEIKNVEEIYKNFSFTGDSYSVLFKESYSGSVIAGSTEYKINSNGKNLTLDSNILISQNYSDEQKRDIANFALELISELIKEDKQVAFLPEDLKDLLDKIINTKKTNLSLNINYDIASRDVTHSLDITIDDLKINSDGSLAYKDKNYNGTVKLVTPKILIAGITGLYDGGLNRVIEKSGANMNYANLVVDNIRNNGMDFLATFDKKNALKDDDAFEANIHFNLENFDFKVNDKGIIHLLTDERVVKFLKNMPEHEKKD